MGHYPFTVFNGITLLVLALTALVLWRRFLGTVDANWPLVCYAAIILYTMIFSGSLNPYSVALAVACAMVIRTGFHASQVRWMEAVPLAYIGWRCFGLLLMW